MSNRTPDLSDLDRFKIFGREPALWIGVISAGLVLLGTQGFPGMTPEHASLWIAAVNAVAGAAVAATTRPIAPGAFTSAVAAVAAVAGAYGFELSTEALGGINGLVVAVLVLITRGEVSPQDTRVSRRGDVTLAA